jgi:hypothetical protein
MPHLEGRRQIEQLRETQQLRSRSHLHHYASVSIQGVPFRHPLPTFYGLVGNDRAFFLADDR